MGVLSRFSSYIYSDLRYVSSLFLVIDFLIYFDRGVLPGLHHQVIQDIVLTPFFAKNPELWFGCLQSIFIFGLALSAPALSYIACHTGRVLQLIALGLVIWEISLFGCFVFGNNGYMVTFFFCRAMSGVGEAAFTSLLTPVLLDAQPPNNKGLFLGVFYAMMPCGVAFGYVISSLLPHFGYSYAAAFFLLSTFALPPAAVVVSMCYLEEIRGQSWWNNHVQLSEDDTLSNVGITPVKIFDIRSTKISLPSDGTINKASTEPKLCQVFMFLMISGAAMAAVTASLSSFGIAFLTSLKILKSEVAAATAMGFVAVFIGAVGTLLGGYISQHWMNLIVDLDRLQSLRISSQTILFFGFCGGLLTQLTPILLLVKPGSQWLAIFTMSLGLLLISMTQSSLNMGIMCAFPREHRSMALSIYALGLHLLGDVPGPIVIGYLKDKLAPGCLISVELCDAQRNWLILVLTIALSWVNGVWLGGLGSWWYVI